MLTHLKIEPWKFQIPEECDSFCHPVEWGFLPPCGVGMAQLAQTGAAHSDAELDRAVTTATQTIVSSPNLTFKICWMKIWSRKKPGREKSWKSKISQLAICQLARTGDRKLRKFLLTIYCLFSSLWVFLSTLNWTTYHKFYPFVFTIMWSICYNPDKKSLLLCCLDTKEILLQLKLILAKPQILPCYEVWYRKIIRLKETPGAKMTYTAPDCDIAVPWIFHFFLVSKPVWEFFCT